MAPPSKTAPSRVKRKAEELEFRYVPPSRMASVLRARLRALSRETAEDLERLRAPHTSEHIQGFVTQIAPAALRQREEELARWERAGELAAEICKVLGV